MPKLTTPEWRNRIVGQGEEAPDQLLANPKNWRTHPANQRDALRGALDQVGWVQQVMVNRITGHIVDGHARVEEALTRGEATVPVLYVELEPHEEDVVLATLDPIGALATRDDERLRMLLAEVEFDAQALREMTNDLMPKDAKVGLTDPDAVPDPGDDMGIKRGDLFALGDHRLLCGDATDAGDAERLGTKGDLLYADPPYGMFLDADFSGMVGMGSGKKYDNVKGDHEPYDPTPLLAMYQVDEAILWGADYYAERIADRNAGSWFVWDKMGGGEGVNDAYDKMFGSNFELAWSRKRHKRALVRVLWKGIFGLAGEDTSKRVHPTQKPTELARWFIEKFASAGGVVIDPYLGSGSTLIAAEQTGRRCQAMEIEPQYVAVAINRWEDFTGRKAVKLG